MSYPSMLLKLSHVFYHQPEQVFDLWVDEHHAASWLFGGPDQYTDVIRIDARVGGRFFASGRSGAKPIVHQGQFHVLQRPQQILFSVSPYPDQMEPDLIQIKFERCPFGCELHLTHQLSARFSAERPRLIENWTQLFARMALELDDSSSPQPQISSSKAQISGLV
ncbi:MAG TPA: hypothetical protein DCS87_02235 [Rheinheimera sp.]|nr:hypothetical protein [Rheinheimera sp.]